MAILRNSFGRNAANLNQVVTPDDRSRTAEKSSIPEVVALLQHFVKQFITDRNLPTCEQVTLERVRVIEPVRRLHQGYFGVLEEADGVL